jgi:hypothetical protein
MTVLRAGCIAALCLLCAVARADDAQKALIEKISHGDLLPKWRFLGIRTDNYGRSYYVFFAADTIRPADKHLSVIVGSAEYRTGFTTSPELFVSGVQEGHYRPGGLAAAEIDCASELIVGYSDAKLFEDHIAGFVCAHAPKGGH